MSVQRVGSPTAFAGLSPLSLIPVHKPPEEGAAAPEAIDVATIPATMESSLKKADDAAAAVLAKPVEPSSAGMLVQSSPLPESKEGDEKKGLLSGVCGTPFQIIHDGSETGKLTAEIVQKAWELGAPRHIIAKIFGGTIDGNDYIIVPVVHKNAAFNQLINWLFEGASHKRFGLFTEGAMRNPDREREFIEYAKKTSPKEFRNIEPGGFIYGMEDRYWSEFIDFGTFYFDLKTRGLTTVEQGNSHYKMADSQLIDVACQSLGVLDSSPEQRQMWEIFEKTCASHAVFRKIFKNCKFPKDASMGVRVKTFLRTLRTKSDPFEVVAKLTEMYKVLFEQTLDHWTLFKDKEKKLLRTNVINYPDAEVAYERFLSFHHHRRDPIMSSHCLNTQLPPGTIRVIEVGAAHVRTLWKVMQEQSATKKA